MTARGTTARAAAARARVATALAAAALVLVAGCAGIGRVQKGDEPLADMPFHVEGRLSAHRDREALAGQFDWQHAPATDAISLATPLGQTLATIDRIDATVALRLADGRYLEAPSFEALTQRAFGVPLPVSGLTAWIRGGGRAGSPFTVERDAAGRASVLRQDGWQITYDYADDAARRPRRLMLAYPGVDMRVVVDRWQ